MQNRHFRDDTREDGDDRHSAREAISHDDGQNLQVEA
jgi:hypothetical protein